jgi:1-acyl-sn-glycerol-3-phosphate acyltransferase
VAEWFFHPGSAICGFIGRVLWDARVEGTDRIPREGPFVLVANHCSNFDPPLLGWAIGNGSGRVIHFMSKIEMRSWPVIGWLATQSAVFFVRRGENDRSAQRFALAALTAGRPIALFPEGTRSRDGRMKAFKPGAAYLAMRAGAPVLPVAIAGTHRLFPNRSRVPHPSRVRITVGEPLSLGQLPPGRGSREAVDAGTDRIREAIAAMLPPEQRPL